MGEPGQRVFYLQARVGERRISLKLEKQQVGAICDFIDQVLAELESHNHPEVTKLKRLTAQNQLVVARDPDGVTSFSDPEGYAWVVGGIQIGFNSDDNSLVMLAEELVADDSEGSEQTPVPGALARYSVSIAHMSLLRHQGRELLSGGRPPCRLCGFPLDPTNPSDHVCPKRNGHHPPS